MEQVKRRIDMLRQFSDLLMSLTKKEIRVRYKRSLLGIFWALGEPLLQMALFSVIFSMVLKLRIEKYPVFVLTGLVVWNFIVSSLRSAVNSITTNSNIVKKIYFPREILVLSSVFARFFHFLVSLVILFLFFLLFKIKLSLYVVYFPLLIACMVLFVLGFALVVSAFNVLYTDTSFLLDFFVFLWFYGSPIFYSSDMVPESFKAVYMLNPAASIIEAFRNIFMYGRPPELMHIIVSLFWALISCIAGYTIFVKFERRFAEVL